MNCRILDWIFVYMDIFGYIMDIFWYLWCIGYGYGKSIEDEKVCQTVAFGCLLLRPHCIQLWSQLPKGYPRIAKTTSTYQSNSNPNHTVQHPSITDLIPQQGLPRVMMLTPYHGFFVTEQEQEESRILGVRIAPSNNKNWDWNQE